MISRLPSRSLSLGFCHTMPQIKTFAFLDLETTGLPFMENNKTKITELSIMSVQSDHLSLGVVPRVQNKLSLCFNPRKLISIDSERITGLSNEKLEFLSPFNAKTVDMINFFLDHCPKPICFVAHNGYKFDYPILRKEIENTGQNFIGDLLCIDSLETFRQLHMEELLSVVSQQQDSTPDTTDSTPLEFQDGFDELLCKVLDDYEDSIKPDQSSVKRALEVQKVNETTPHKAMKRNEEKQMGDGNLRTDERTNKRIKISPSRKKLNFGVSYKLQDVYERLTNSEPIEAHRAEGDVTMLAMCAATLGDRFTKWANENARNFNETPILRIGRKLGL